jgi:hypothetical protein
MPGPREGLARGKAGLDHPGMMMPNEDGLQLYRRSTRPSIEDIPVIMVSSVGRNTFLQYQRS